MSPASPALAGGSLRQSIQNKPASVCNANRIRQQFIHVTHLDIANAPISVMILLSFHSYSDLVVGFKQIEHEVNVCFLSFTSYTIWFISTPLLTRVRVRILTLLGPILVSGTLIYLIYNKYLLNKWVNEWECFTIFTKFKLESLDGVSNWIRRDLIKFIKSEWKWGWRWAMNRLK